MIVESYRQRPRRCWTTPGPGRDLQGGPDLPEITTLDSPLAALQGRVTVSIEEAARLLGLGRSAAYEAARRGELPTRRLGRRPLVPVLALLEWLGAAMAA